MPNNIYNCLYIQRLQHNLNKSINSSKNKPFMTIKYISTDDGTKIEKLTWISRNTKENKLKIIIDRLKSKAKHYEKYKDRDFRALDDIYYWQNLLSLITDLCEYRVIWNDQFPERKKKIKYHKKLLSNEASIRSFNTLNEVYPAESQYHNPKRPNINFGTAFYDILRRVENLIGYKLYYNQDARALVPEFFFTDVITETDSGKIIYIKYPTFAVNSTTIEWKGKRFTKNCIIKAANSNTDAIEMIPKFIKNAYHKCELCKVVYTKSSKFLYNPLIDTHCCKNCHITYKNYKQPVWNIDNIFHDSYHGNRSGFRFVIRRQAHENSIPIGMELETEFRTRQLKTSRSEILYKMWSVLGQEDIVFERDGSLNSYGVECITNPMTSEYARVYWLKAKDFLKSHTNGLYSGIAPYSVGETTNFWGIHLTFARKYWSNTGLAKFTNFMYNDSNKEFLQAIAQRVNNYSGGAVGAKKSEYKKDKQFTIDKSILNTGPGEKIKDPNRSTTVNLSKKSLIEVRMFNSTNDVEEILKNYDFITAMHDWICNYPVSFTPSCKDFLKWLLDSNNNERIRKYQYLIKYLKREMFQIRNQNEIIVKQNPWIKNTSLIQLPKSFSKPVTL